MTEAKERIEFFAAANTAEGFVSYFDEVFFAPEIERRYIIKGGPGTGKSSLMRFIAHRAEQKGLEVEYYYCSSDTESLDGVIIGSRVAVFDGTAPHGYDTVIAGAQDEIINLGQFWDSQALENRLTEIRSFGTRKKGAYSAAYGYLSAANTIRSVADGSVIDCVDLKKLRHAAMRTYSRLELPSGETAGALTRQVRALGVHGEAELGTLQKMAKRTHLISDYYGTAYLYLSELEQLAIAHGARVLISRDVMDKTRAGSMLFASSGDYFTVAESANDANEVNTNEVINMKRFVDATGIGKIRFSWRSAMRACDNVKALALAELSEAGKAHAQIEKIYVPCMDFARQAEFSAALSEKILARF